MAYQYAVRTKQGVLLIRKLTRQGAEDVAKKYEGAYVSQESSIEEN